MLFDFQAVVHEFDVEIIAAENVLEFAGGTQRVIELAQAQTSLDDARRAAGRGDDAFRIFGEDFLIHTRIAHDSAFKVRVGGGFHEVDEAFVVFCPHFRFGDQNAGAERHDDRAVHPLGFRLACLCAADGHRVRIDADDRAAHDASAAERGVDRVPLLPLLRREILVERTEVQIVEGFLLRFGRFRFFFRCGWFFLAIGLYGF